MPYREPKSYQDILSPDALAALPWSTVGAHLHLPDFGRTGAAARYAAMEGVNGENENNLLPCVVQLHGSFGWLSHHNKHRDTLVQAGFAVLQIDSFASRGVEQTAEKQGAVTGPTLTHDAFSGLAMLRYHPLIDKNRVGMAGWSLGGGAAVYAALDAVNTALNPQGLSRFVAHLGVYPGNGLRTGNGHTWSPSPVVMLCGTADDYTPVFQCDSCAARIKEQGAILYLK